MKHQNTLTHLLDLKEEIVDAFERKCSVVSIFFDIEKAYDTAWKYDILRKLTTNGIKGRLSYFISNFLQDRGIQVRVGNTLSAQHPILNGIPQGSVISVYCFLLLINDVVNRIPAPIHTRLFADDLNISLTTSNLQYAKNILQICLSNLQEWSNTLG
jgi:hypothetical protein